MDKKMIIVVISFSMISGFIGGIIAESVMRPAYSKTPNIINADVVKSHSIDVVDSQGKTLLHLGKRPGSLIGMDLYDQNSLIRSSLFLTINGFPMLSLYDSHGNFRASLDMINNSPSLSLSDSKGKIRASLGVIDNSPALFLYDSHGNFRASLDMYGNSPALSLYDSKGRERNVIGNSSLQTIRTGATTETGESSIVLFDKKGKVIWQAPQ